MHPKDFLYDQTFKAFIGLGFNARDAGYVAADAVHMWMRDKKATDAMESAIKKGKKLYKPSKKVRANA